MLEEWTHYNSGKQVEKSGFYSCYKTGETVKMEKGEVFPECEGNVWIVSE